MVEKTVHTEMYSRCDGEEAWKCLPNAKSGRSSRQSDHLLLPVPSTGCSQIYLFQCVSSDTLYCFFCVFYIILQQKNTCAHNSTHKAHANGIKKAKRTKYVSTRGMDPKFLRNQKYAKKYNGSKRVHEE